MYEYVLYFNAMPYQSSNEITTHSQTKPHMDSMACLETHTSTEHWIFPEVEFHMIIVPC